MHQNDYSDNNYRRFKKTLKWKDEQQSAYKHNKSEEMNTYKRDDNLSESDQKTKEIYDTIDSIERELLNNHQ